MKINLLFLFILGFLWNGKSQTSKSDLILQLDSLLSAPSEKPFNGKVLIGQKDSIIYKRTKGFFDIPHKVPFSAESQFVIGSISKQFTAVLALIEIEEKRLDLYKPIKFYLPDLTQTWADSVNSHHLLTHMHGIQDLDEPLAFEPGTMYQYSQIGYELLSKVVEKTSKKSFEQLSMELFIYCKMFNTTYPIQENLFLLSQAHTEDSLGKTVYEPNALSNYVPAGSFVSTLDDLFLWNQQFYSGKLLNRKVMQLLTSKHAGAVRDHPLFGITEYGYGITVDTKDGILQYGQTGLAPGFVSMSFYFPETKLSVLATMNVQYSPDNITETFDYLLKIRELVRSSVLVKEITETKTKKRR